MALETATLIHQLDVNNPAPTDQLRQADDHLRLIKSVLKNTFPNINGPVTATDEQINNPFSLPVGLITLWFGTASTVPSGWAICDGSSVPRSDGSGNVTVPDLRGRVPVGADASNAPGATFGSSTSSATSSSSGSHTHTVDGGAHTHSAVATPTSLTIEQMPAHTHANGITNSTSSLFSRGATPAATVTLKSAADSSNNGTLEGFTETVGGGAAHTHDVTVGSATHTHEVSTAAAHTHSVTVSTVQPSLALHFIMKV